MNWKRFSIMFGFALDFGRIGVKKATSRDTVSAANLQVV